MDKVVLITGASSGIGAASARALVAAGAKVALFARSADKLQCLQEEFGADNALVLPGDVTKQTDVDGLVPAILEKFGRLDAVFANAGAAIPGRIADGDPEVWARGVDLNIMGVLRTLRATVPHFVAQQAGQILLTASIAGRTVWPGEVVYSATKYAVYGIAEGLRKEVAKSGVGVGVISPGYTLNEFWGERGTDPEAQKRQSEEGSALLSENIAQAVVFALSQPPHVNITDMLVLPTRQDVPAF
jgi:ribitol 2-dehydrogenase